MSSRKISQLNMTTQNMIRSAHKFSSAPDLLYCTAETSNNVFTHFTAYAYYFTKSEAHNMHEVLAEMKTRLSDYCHQLKTLDL